MKKEYLEKSKKKQNLKNDNLRSKKQKGITLIALVISIVVMLVLAGVSLNLTIGDNGIISKAQESKLRKEEADVETEILSGVSALDMEYYEKVSSDSGITISSIYSISGLSKYVKGKINGFSYSKNGTTTVYYTNEIGSYTVIIDENGKAKTYSGIYVEKNNTVSLQMSENDKIKLSSDMKNVTWAVVSGGENGTVDAVTGEVVKNSPGTIIVKGVDEEGNEVTIIIKDSIENNVAENINVTNAIEEVQVNDNVKAYIVPGENGNKLVVKGNGDLNKDIIMQNALTVREIIVENGITYINGPFANFKNTQSITIPETLQSFWYIGEGLQNLSTINYNAISAMAEHSIGEIQQNGEVYANSSTLFYLSNRELEVNIGNNVQTIPEGFFAECSNLKYISIPNSVKKIEKKAFDRCSGLKYVELGESIEEIGEYAFRLSGIKSIVLPENIKKIGIYAFEYCNNLTNVVYNAINCEYSVRASVGIRPLFLIDANNGNDVLQKIVIGNKVEKIPKGMFSGLIRVTEIEIPSSVKVIEENAFCKTGLQEITIPENVTEIGREAFSYCNSLAKVVYNAINCEYDGVDNYVYPLFNSTGNGNDILQEIVIGNKVEKIPKGMFSFLNKVEEIEIPTSVKVIEERAFLSSIGIKKIELNNGLSKIGENAFYYTGLQEITIPETITEIGKSAFSKCNSLTKVVYNAINCEYDGVSDYTYPLFLLNGNAGNDILQEIVIGSKVQKIPEAIFSYINNVSKIEIPSSVKTIGTYSFLNNKGMQRLILNEGLEKVGRCAFERTNIKEVVIPESVTEIGREAFSYCNSLEKVIYNAINCEYDGVDDYVYPLFNLNGNDGNDIVQEITIGNKVTKIPEGMFAFLNKVNKIEIPSSVKIIEIVAFANSKGIKEIILNEGLEKIDFKAFYNTGLERITIPKSLKLIRQSAFENCNSLKEIIVKKPENSLSGAPWSNVSGITVKWEP